MWRPGGLDLLLLLLAAAWRPAQAVTGGAQTTIERHPYQVAVDREGEMVCGGALLSAKTVITAASCFLSDIYPRTLAVRVGSQVRDEGGEAFDVEDYELHPDYNVYWGNNDALLLYLKDEVPFRAAVRPVALSSPSASLSARSKLVLSGYGDLYQDEVLDDGEQRQLQAATLAVFNQDLCNELYYFTPAEGNNRACAGGVNSDMCGTRDIGSPLVDWQGRLAGLALQQRKTCGVPGLPTSFSNLADPALNQWVTDNIK